LQIKKRKAYITIMKILIYTYGNHKMGMGHIVRMLCLSETLERKGHTVSFLVPDWKEGIKKLKNERKKIIKISLNDFEQSSAYRKVLNDYDSDCIIVDALKVAEPLMKLFRQKGKLLVSLDNTGEGRVFSDILINILYRKLPKLKKPKLEINDFNYLILNENFGKFNSKQKPVPEKARNLLITQGGSDTYGMVPKIINELNGLPKGLKCYVLVGSAFKHRRELTSSVKNKKLKVKILEDIKEPWKLFYEMDMAITGGGMTLFELLCVGVPCVTVTQEYKELETLSYLEKLDLIENLGFYKDLKKGALKKRIIQLMDNYSVRTKRSKKGKRIIDGKGVERVISLIENYFNRFK